MGNPGLGEDIFEIIPQSEFGGLNMVNRTIITVESHTAGEPTRIIIGGIPHVPGRNMMEKKEYFRKNLDFLRTALIWEPRGHRDMFGCTGGSSLRRRSALGSDLLGL